MRSQCPMQLYAVGCITGPYQHPVSPAKKILQLITEQGAVLLLWQASFWRCNYQDKTAMSKQKLFIVIDCKDTPFSLQSELCRQILHHTHRPVSGLHITPKGPAFSVLLLFSKCLKNFSVVWIFHHYIYTPLCILLSEYFSLVFFLQIQENDGRSVVIELFF